MVKRGDIYYIDRASTSTTGSEMYSSRPGIIVSNDVINRTGTVVQVVYLTTAPKKDMPTHVSIRSTGQKSTAICEQVVNVSTQRLKSRLAECTTQEMEQINIALMVSLWLDAGEPQTVEVERVVKVPDTEAADKLKNELAVLQGKYDLLYKLYTSGCGGTKIPVLNIPEREETKRETREETDVELSARLKRARIEAGFDQKTLAKFVGKHGTMITSYEKGRVPDNKNMIRRLIKIAEDNAISKIRFDGMEKFDQKMLRDLIARSRYRSGLSQVEFAKLLGMSANRYAAFENGEATVSSSLAIIAIGASDRVIKKDGGRNA